MSVAGLIVVHLLLIVISLGVAAVALGEASLSDEE
jgi:hypothetical protein